MGNFIAFVGNLDSRKLVERSVGLFRENILFPAEGVAAPGWITGIDWSDHRSFWKYGYKAAMITDTALFRYPYYHTREDTIDKIRFSHLARVVEGLEIVLRFF